MTALLRYLLLTALRDRMVLAMLMAMLAIALGSGFVGEQAVNEAGAYGLTFAAFAIRLVLVGGMVLFIAIQIRRAMENREIMVFLSRPISRERVVLGYWLSFLAIATLLLLPAAAIVALVAAPDLLGLAVWTGTLLLEVGVMIGVALFFALGLNGVVAIALCCLGFYLLARIIGVLLAIAGSEFRSFADLGSRGAEGMAEALGLILPRLDLMAQGRWLTQGPVGAEALPLILGQGIVYAAFMLFAAMYDFRRKRF